MTDRARSIGLGAAPGAGPGLTALAGLAAASAPARGLVLGGVLLLAACGGGAYVQDPPEESYTNPDHCLGLVEEHRATPTTLGSDGPVPRRIPVPLGLEGGPWVVDLVVDEHGKAVPESIEVTGDGPGTSRLRIRDSAIQSVFQPAQLDGCWVPARFSYTIQGGNREPENRK